MSVIITANRLTDGVVVFLGGDGGWVEQIGEAAVLSPAESVAALARAEADAARQIVVGPYEVDVVRKGDGFAPKALREAIRASGPTVRPDLAKPTAI